MASAACGYGEAYLPAMAMTNCFYMECSFHGFYALECRSVYVSGCRGNLDGCEGVLEKGNISSELTTSR